MFGGSELVEERNGGTPYVYKHSGELVTGVGADRVFHDGLGSAVIQATRISHTTMLCLKTAGRLHYHCAKRSVMLLEELERIVDQSLSGEAVVDVSAPEEYPGWVRRVIVRQECCLSVEYEQWGIDEGGEYFYGKYETLPELIADVEDFLAKPMSSWRWVQERPRPSGDARAGYERLQRDIAQRTVRLPQHGQWMHRGEGLR